MRSIVSRVGKHAIIEILKIKKYCIVVRLYCYSYYGMYFVNCGLLDYNDAIDIAVGGL